MMPLFKDASIITTDSITKTQSMRLQKLWVESLMFSRRNNVLDLLQQAQVTHDLRAIN
jgi:hypothetical protein